MLQTQTIGPLIESTPPEMAEEAGLRYVSDSKPGIKRVRKGSGFIYLDKQNQQIKDEKTLERIKNLGIPPAWSHVWISSLTNGHIQATGLDEKGRKQYRYHADWVALSQEKKFEKMLFFSEILPELRAKLKSDMSVVGLPKNKILATVVYLLEKTYIRVGNDEYAKENQHYGLTTLRSKHVSVDGSEITFEFVGKSGKEHLVDFRDRRVASIIRNLEELPGYELFQYVDEDGKRHLIDSGDVNEYLQSITGEGISAKDFRTWGGTVLSAVTLRDLGDFESETQAKKNLIQAVRIVASYLRNTTAVCRSYYIHPVIPTSYQKKLLLPHFAAMLKRLKEKPELLENDEYAVALLLKDQAD